MANRSKRIGTGFETDIVNYLQPWFPQVERRALAGNMDKGDLLGVPDWVIEAKARKILNIGVWVNEAIVEARNAGTRHWVVVHKRSYKSTALAHATIDLQTWVELQHGVFSLGLVEPADSIKDFSTRVLQYLLPLYPFSVLQGDHIVGIPGWDMMVKSSTELDMDGDATRMTQLHKTTETKWLMVHRRRSHSTAEAYCTMTLETWKDLISGDAPPTVNGGQ